MDIVSDLATPEQLATAALDYAARGWCVLPCHTVDPSELMCTCGNLECPSPGKHPLLANGVKGATTDAAIISQWWREAPQANIGIATGPESGIFVVDLDGADGCRAFLELSKNQPDDGRHTFCVNSGGGGCHLYYKWPELVNVGNRSKINGLPIDARGSCGYVIAPPSFHKSGRRYKLDLDLPVASAPSWLEDFLTAAPPKPPALVPLSDNGGALALRVVAGGSDLESRVKAYLAKCPPAVSGQGGHNHTFAVCCAVVHGFALTLEQALPWLSEWNLRCQPPWSDRELRHKLSDAAKAEGERGKFLVESNGQQCNTALPTSPIILPDTIYGWQLMAMDLPEPAFVVPGYITVGATLLAGRPKIGKSWLALQLAIGAAHGGSVLGQITTSGDVLYMALEDNRRRLKSRVAKLLKALSIGDVPRRLSLATQWPRMGEGGIEAIISWLKEHPGAKLVIIDTLTRLRPRRPRRGDLYAEDYSDMATFAQLAAEHHVAILPLHHDRKMGASDPFDTVSGTLGLTGAADAVLILKRSRMTPNSILSITGRDVEEQELALKFDAKHTIWTVVGDAKEVERSEKEAAIVAVLQASAQPLRPKQIKEELESNESADTIRQRLHRMRTSGVIVKEKEGYRLA